MRGQCPGESLYVACLCIVRPEPNPDDATGVCPEDCAVGIGSWRQCLEKRF